MDEKSEPPCFGIRNLELCVGSYPPHECGVRGWIKNRKKPVFLETCLSCFNTRGRHE